MLEYIERGEFLREGIVVVEMELLGGCQGGEGVTVVLNPLFAKRSSVIQIVESSEAWHICGHYAPLEDRRQYSDRHEKARFSGGGRHC